jgi:sortase A
MTFRRTLRISSTLMMVAGVLLLAWAFVVWQWGDPITSVYTRWEQRKLASSFDETLRAAQPGRAAAPAGRPPAVTHKAVPRVAARFWRRTGEGDAVARLTIDRLGLRVIVVKGTDTGSLRKGPGVDGRTALPGEGRLVYIAGHRTTYGAPFGDIDRLRRGDSVVLELPYGRFDYVVTGHRIVDADDLSVLRSPGHEVVALQACHPRFFATERYIVYALPRSVVRNTPRAAQVAA